MGVKEGFKRTWNTYKKHREEEGQEKAKRQAVYKEQYKRGQMAAAKRHGYKEGYKSYSGSRGGHGILGAMGTIGYGSGQIASSLLSSDVGLFGLGTPKAPVRKAHAKRESGTTVHVHIHSNGSKHGSHHAVHKRRPVQHQRSIWDL